MAGTFSDEFTVTQLIFNHVYSSFENTITGLPGCGWVPDYCSRTIGATVSTVNTFGHGDYLTYYYDGLMWNGSAGPGGTTGTTGITANTYFIGEKSTFGVEVSGYNGEVYVENIYYLIYLKSTGPVLNISGATGIKFQGVKISKTNSPYISSETIIVKASIYYTFLGATFLIKSNGFYLNNGLDLVLYIPNFTNYSMFDPTKVTKILFEFNVKRMMTANISVPLNFVFTTDKITLV